jgi:hypothetical protein
MIWTLHGTETQQRIAREGLALCDFPFDRLAPQLKSEVGRDSIPVEWADLSRYSAAPAVMVNGAFNPAVTVTVPQPHIHVHEDGDTGHPIVREVDGRARVLGLAWYSGKVTLDLGLEQDPRLAHEVLLAEGAHMIDFFYMHNQHRRAIVNALHHNQLPPHALIENGKPLGLDGHECGWFDVGPYGMWVGEAMMEAFIEAFSPVRVTIQLGHPVSPVQAAYIRRVLLGPVLVGTARGRAYHRPTCPFIRPSWVLASHDWPAPVDAQRDGRRACRVCRPA